ncbi:MAG: alpha/beta hydrolase domain-containing protein [Pseudomonadota bacterium]
MIRALEITERNVVLGGASFGDKGAYEKITGFAYFEFDPASPANKNIFDLDKASTNNRGMVEARSNFYVLQPVEPKHRAGVGVMEVVNRGNKTLFNKLNRWKPSAEHIAVTQKGGARGGVPLEVGCMPHDPDEIELFGDTWLMRQGYTVIWVGWEADILPNDHQMYFEAPAAEGVTGLVRNLALVPQGAKTIPIGQWGTRPHPAANPDDPTLELVRQDPNTKNGDQAETVIPRDRWTFARESEGGEIVPDPTYIYCADGFEGGVYRLVYESENPPIFGLGFAAIRDMASYAKYHDDCPFPVDMAITIGRSQTGRFQLDYLYSGVNGDEAGRKGLDGVMPHTGGAGRGSFNVRFGQPTTGCNHFAATLFPVDMFPFTAEVQTDPFTGRSAGLYDKNDPEHLPKVFHVNTGWEYWARANSLLHTSIDGERDSPEASHERHYYFSGTQHSVEMTPFPPKEDTRLPESLIYRGNFQDYHFALRQLVVHMVNWIRDGKQPPESRVPKYANDDIVHPDDMSFPDIRHMGRPGDADFYEAWVMDYGPRFYDEGVIDNEPPKLSGQSYPSFVSKTDAYGNEVAGIPTLELVAPLATYTPWRRYDYPNSFTMLTDAFTGAVVPFPRTAAEKEKFGDPRPALDVLYASKDDYLAKARDAAQKLVDQGYLLKGDVDDAVGVQSDIWDWIMSRPDYSDA